MWCHGIAEGERANFLEHLVNRLLGVDGVPGYASRNGVVKVQCERPWLQQLRKVCKGILCPVVDLVHPHVLVYYARKDTSFVEQIMCISY